MRISDILAKADGIEDGKKELTINVNGISWKFPKGKYQVGGDVGKKTRKTGKSARSESHKETGGDSD